MDLGLNGRTVIVTGASGGIGREIARGFGAEGADVVLTYHRARDQAERLAKEIEQAGGRALAVRHDMADPGSTAALARAATDWTGRIDVLVNNAVHWGADAPDPESRYETVPDESWQATVRHNIEGAIRLSREVTPVMRRREWGRMVHISSSLATDGGAGSEYYAAAKAALHGFSRSLAFSLGKDGDILSNVVMPGLTRTDTNGFVTDQWADHYSALTPIGRLLTAAEVAAPVVFLASAANTGITGQAITVTGGA
ncbi:SDR family NAD(P)-dependent oxidoreductase [Thermomonospora cellulosilytica]|uniref:NAD(P)-dependent dehydrogenase (Short-subunit alcohol dehydrogenase family) n=1 Tax=Thermomonospora cellulosilytica TaxID=1411118 RepID=A0A7W3R618_9ACTN|nr:SDR family oxidoreductase [Thermomonospora cellulosilytica]MBA9001142.1 NAD(P)-dependent dehydrogenase (short-subunit alcohol dehydrogenase family) [Thermomonospora cellulosilytica]